MEYIGEGSTLPPPLNILGSPKAIIRAIFCRSCYCKDDEEDEALEMGEPEGGRGKSSSNGLKRDRRTASVSAAVAANEAAGPSSAGAIEAGVGGAVGAWLVCVLLLVVVVLLLLLVVVPRPYRRRWPADEAAGPSSAGAIEAGVGGAVGAWLVLLLLLVLVLVLVMVVVVVPRQYRQRWQRMRRLVPALQAPQRQGWVVQ